MVLLNFYQLAVLCTWLAGPKITLRFPHVLVVCLYLGVRAAIHLPPSIFNWHIIKEVMYSLEVCYHFLWIVWIVESVELLRGSWMSEVKGHRWNEQIPFLLCSIYGCTTCVRPFDYLIHDAPCYTPIVELCRAILCNELQSVCQFGSPDNITSLVEIQLD